MPCCAFHHVILVLLVSPVTDSFLGCVLSVMCLSVLLYCMVVNYPNAQLIKFMIVSAISMNSVKQTCVKQCFVEHITEHGPKAESIKCDTK